METVTLDQWKDLMEVLGRIPSKMGQVVKVLRFLESVSPERLQGLLESGLFPEMLRMDPRLIDRQNLFLQNLPRFSVNKVLTVGNFRSGQQMLNELKLVGCELSEEIELLLELNLFPLSSSVKSLQVVAPTVEELGFTDEKDGIPTERIYSQAVSLGLSLCHPEIAFQMMIQRSDQEVVEGAWVGMDSLPIFEKKKRFLGGFRYSPSEYGRRFILKVEPLNQYFRTKQIKSSDEFGRYRKGARFVFVAPSPY